ncbi:uncharacterized protein LOC123981380 isoform X1 [Tachysurus ichikawai]
MSASLRGHAPPVPNTRVLILHLLGSSILFLSLDDRAKETALLLLQHVFRLYGLPRDIVSDRVYWEPQSACHLDSTPRPMVRSSAVIRIWRQAFAS